MEHRWGQRIAVNIPIRLRLSRSGPISIGRLTNVSLSGAFLTPRFDLRTLARLQVFFEIPRTKRLPSATDAFVARISAQGIGLEWCDFSPPAVVVLIRSLSAPPLLGWQNQHSSSSRS